MIAHQKEMLQEMFHPPKIIGHRGCAGYAPENTLPALHTAADMGLDWVEVDVKLTKDDVPIIFHDDLLDRTTNGSGAVKEHTYAQIKELDAGAWFDDGFYDTRTPTLEQALDVLLKRKLAVNIEIKPCEGREIHTAEAVLDALANMWDAVDRILISSFSYECMETAVDMLPDFPRGFLLPEEWPENWQTLLNTIAPKTIHVNGNIVTEEQINVLLPYKLPILAYTIDDPRRASILRDWGVNGFFCDTPDMLDDVFE